MNRDDPLDALYYECVPHRISRPGGARMADGPTARWAELELEREKWALLREVGDDEAPSGAVGAA